ncbi:flavin reductase like domain-containing protein [Myxozyma melibiosi]|uniref:Flavin reductase like domain-containing protein n=1 Tax=Myxozyma melibiosi TaxID=54550 RepID=A0ABR1F2K6_9ASCO
MRIPHAARGLHSSAVCHDLSLRFKQLMARHAAPLAVISAAHANDRRAATVSSVTSLSVSDQAAPLITFNLKLPSSTSRLIHDSGRFSVNFLSGAPAAEEIARGFAGVARPANLKETDYLEQDVEVVGVDWFPVSDAPFETPMLNRTRVLKPDEHSPDSSESSSTRPANIAFARVDCTAKHCFSVRDHEIWVGEVERLELEDENLKPPPPALVYFNRQFVRVHVANDAAADEKPKVRRSHLSHE